MKKIIALAVLGAFAAPAFADSGNVTIDGYVRTYYRHDNDVANGTAAQNKIDGRGEVRFSGSEDLGNGNSAIFKIGSRFSSDGSGSISGNGQFGNQTTYVGLKGSWGQFTMGNVADNFGDGKYSNGVVIDESPRNALIGSQRATNGARKNAVRYDLPAMGGFTASGVWQMGENKTTTAKAADNFTLRADYDADNWGIGAAYEGGRGDLSAATGAGSFTGAGTNDKYAAYNITGAVSFGDFQVGLEYQNTKDKEAGMNNATNKTTGLYLNYSMDKWNFGAQFWRSKDRDAAGGSARTNTYELLANYALSKRTKAFAEFLSGKTKDGNADYAADPHAARTIVVGLRHAF